MRFLLQQGCRRGEAKVRTEAALVAYDQSSRKVNKAQKKKILSEARTAASKSVYPGTFETHDGMARETFSDVLSELVTNSDSFRGSGGRTYPKYPVDRLVVRYTDPKIGKEYLSRRDFYE